MKALLISSLPEILGAFSLMALNAALIAFQWAFLKIHLNGSTWTNRNATNSGDDDGPRGFREALLERPDRVLQALRLASLACVVGAGFLFWECGWHLWEGATDGHIQDAFNSLFSLGLFLAILVILYPFTELIPTTVGLHHAEGSLSKLAWLVRLVEWLTAPVRRPLQALVGALLGRILIVRRPENEKGEQKEIANVPPTPIAALQPDGSALGEIAGKILRNALTLQELVVSDVLLPRNQVQYMDLGKSLEENLRMARKTGHTRFPLCEGDLDRCIGLIHIKDIFRRSENPRPPDLRMLKREILHLGSEDPLEEALTKLLGNKMHMALVVDEFRGAEGVLTLERVLEVLVGDIQDEFDTEEENIRLEPNGEFRVLGLTPLHALDAAFNIRTENDEVSTFSGLITSELGRIPLKGEHIELHGLSIRITEVDERRIVHARVQPILSVPNEEEAMSS